MKYKVALDKIVAYTKTVEIEAKDEAELYQIAHEMHLDMAPEDYDDCDVVTLDIDIVDEQDE